MVAASEGDADMVELLLANGADATLVDDLGAAAHHVAAAQGHTEIVDLLLRKSV